MRVVPKPYLPPWAKQLELCHSIVVSSCANRFHKQFDVLGRSSTGIEVVKWSYISNELKDEICELYSKVAKHREYMVEYRKCVLDEDNDDESTNERESETMIKAEEIAEILTDNLRYVEVKFPNTIDKSYVYKVPNDIGTVVAGDKVVVGSGSSSNRYITEDNEVRVVEVVAVYPNYTSVPSDKKRVKISSYIINKIDFSPYNAAIKLEKEIVSFVETKQREAIRNQLRAAVTAEFPELLKFAQLEAPKPTDVTPNT